MMFTGKVGINDLSGPVGTVSIMSDIVEESKADGAFYCVPQSSNLAGLISSNLGVMNLLPIPALDGGKTGISCARGVKRKACKEGTRRNSAFRRMILLLILMVYIMFKDIRGLF